MSNKLDSKPLSAEQLVLMEKLNIRHSLVDNFHYRDYRYTKFDDAVAQAMRREKK
jgi:hypothetical protein